MISLEQEERDKFASWLEQEAKSNVLMVEQAKELPGMDPIIKHMQTETAAFVLIASKLRNIEG
jgi:hypothetical protein